ncbi:glycosyltransferase [Paraburkholderia sediminicola]|uniref:glycosyltransferase n=1 Tax=Paraburkholderia sediminicola TaxID=458836 RepID=UPI000EAE0F20
MSNVLYSGFRHDHHNDGAGYDRVVPDGAAYVCGNVLPFGTRPIGTKGRSLNFLIVDILTFLRGLRFPVIHYIYPENTAYVSSFILKALGKRIVFTIHLGEDFWVGEPRSLFYKLKQLNLRCADFVITLSQDQEHRLHDIFPGKTVKFLKHGLEFKNETLSSEVVASRRNASKLLVVGNNYRDFDTLKKIATDLKKHNMELHLVGTGLSGADFNGSSENVVAHGRLTAGEYEKLLLESFAMVLPLTFATANNALLEAHKFALPAICSDIDGVSDYATSSTRFFTSVDEFWREIDSLRALSVDEYSSLCFAGRDDAEKIYDWSVLQKDTQEFFSIE